MGRKTTQRIRISTTSGRLPRIQEVLQEHTARRARWSPWAQRGLYLVGAALVVLCVAGMLGTAFHDAPASVAAAEER